MLAAEEGAFAATLERGQKLLEELLAKAASSKVSAIGESCEARKLIAYFSCISVIGAILASVNILPSHINLQSDLTTLLMILLPCLHFSHSNAAQLLAGSDAFLLYDTFGFPLELTEELAEQRGIKV